MRLTGARAGGGFAGRTLARASWIVLGGALCLSLAWADAPILASVGGRALDHDMFVRRASRLAPFQWARFGATWPERRRRLLDELLVPEALLELEAERQPRGWPPPRESALSHALLAELRAEADSAPVSEQDIERYRTLHRRHYEAPHALLLWRILVRTEREARELIQRLAPPTEAAFRQLARERSIDLATHMRAGTLGYVSASGQSHFPQVRVSPALFAAADQVPDGSVVAEPVAEGNAFAVLWRRATRPAQERPLAEVAPEIRARLREQKLAQLYAALLQKLRQQGLSGHRPELLSGFVPALVEPKRATRDKPSAPPARAVQLVPEPTERGLR